MSSRALFWTFVGSLTGLIALAFWLVMLPRLADPEFAPTQESLLQRGPIQLFLVEPEEVVGVYSHLDLDCAVFHYRTRLPSPEEALAVIDERAEIAGWQVSRREPGLRHFTKLDLPLRGSKALAATRECRVRIEPETGRIVVGWVRVEFDDRPLPLAESERASLVERGVWRRFRDPSAEPVPPLSN